MYRASTGEVVDHFVTHFMYPNRHVYSALAALDHFREASQLDGTAPDPRRLCRAAAARTWGSSERRARSPSAARRAAPSGVAVSS